MIFLQMAVPSSQWRDCAVDTGFMSVGFVLLLLDKHLVAGHQNLIILCTYLGDSWPKGFPSGMSILFPGGVGETQVLHTLTHSGWGWQLHFPFGW